VIVRPHPHPVPLLAAAGLAALLGLAGCGSSEPGAVPGTAGASSEAVVGTDGPFPTVSGGLGEEPTLTFPAGEPADSLQVGVLSPGDGRRVEGGDLVVLDYLGQVWGGEVFDSSFDRGTPMALPIGVGEVIPGWDVGLVGQAVGSRVLLTIPPGLGYGPGGNEAAGISGTDTMVFVVDLLAAYPADAAGSPDAAVTPEAADVPVEIEGAPGAPASVRVPEGTPAPTEGSVTVLARASGPPVEPGVVVVQYAATQWGDGQTQSTWEQGRPATLTLGSGGPFDGLLGVPEGSRALVLIPAEGETPAVAVVVDVLVQPVDTP
jgi:peptidylprolyl isomerase